MLGLNNQVWEDLGITGSIDDDPPCPYSLNSSATREWQSISGCNDGAPTETSFPGSPGRQCSHWDETCMREEIMTPTVEGDLHLSRITIGALEDIGYRVDYSEADVYTAENLSPSCLCSANGISSRSLRQSEASGKKLYKSNFLDEDLEKAMAYGRSIIEQYGMSFTEATGNSTGTEDKLTGGRSVVVYYMNANWEILSVTVTN